MKVMHKKCHISQSIIEELKNGINYFIYIFIQLIPSFNCREFSDLHEKLSCTKTPGSMSLLNCEIYQCGSV